MKNKLHHRLRTIAFYSASNLLLPVFSLVLSLLIVRLCSGKLWGEIVGINLWIMLATQILTWGNRDFLLKEFSKSPANVNDLWRQSFASRWWMLLVAIPFIFFLSFSLYIKVLFILWLCSRFVYQSFDSLIVFERHYHFLANAEALGLLIIGVPVVILQTKMSFSTLVLLFTVSGIAKCGFGIFRYRKLFFSRTNVSFNIKYLPLTFPFLMMALSGTLYGKTDQYCVALMLDKTELAKYAVFMSFLGFAQYASTFVLSPYTKNIFRIQRISFRKIERIMIITGGAFSIVMIIGTFLFMTFFYKFGFSWKMYLLGVMYIYAFYISQLRIVKLVKDNNTGRVVLITLAASAINLILNLLLTPAWKLEGALFSGVIAEWVMVAVYFSKELFPGIMLSNKHSSL